jgi:hypothetical protein
MKKLLFIAAVAVISLASCSKNRTCTCTSTTNDPSQTTQAAAATNTTTYVKVKKTDAELWCGSSTDTQPRTGISPVTGAAYTYIVTTTSTCTLK